MKSVSQFVSGALYSLPVTKLSSNSFIKLGFPSSSCRNFIGWNQKAFIDNILNLSASDARVEFEKLLQYIEDGIAGIDYTELCSRQTVENPNDEDIRLLLNLAANAEQQRQDSLRDSTENGYDDDERSDLGSISTKTEQALYNRKRAEQLARLLIAKKAITDVIKAPNFEEIWVPFCKSETGSSVIRNALVAQKTKAIPHRKSKTQPNMI